MDALYLELLTFGLIRIRDLSAVGRFEEAGVEADHLYNIPSLIGETNKHRHQYYLETERLLYLDRLEALDSDDSGKFVMQTYAGLWRRLEEELASS